MFIKRIGAALVVLIFGLIVINCGGRGVDSGGFSSRQDSFAVQPNQSSSQLFGEIGVEIAAGTYPDGAQLTLKQSGQASQMPPTTNFKLGAPALELSSDAPATKDVVVSIPDDGKQYIAGIKVDSEWLPLRNGMVNGRISFTLPDTLGRSPGRGPGQVWQWVIGLVKNNLPDTGFGIHLVAGIGPLGPGSAIIVHGLMDNYQSVSKMASMLRGRMGWTNVYSLAYDWRLSTPEAAAYLATVLDTQKPNSKSIDLVGHSRGVIVVRYALEKLQKTESVKNCFLFCGPNLGTDAANRADLWFELAREWLSNLYPCSPPTLEALNDPAFEELMLGSSFLNDLNTYRSTQRGNVDYFLVASERDNLVGIDSATALGVAMGELTGGTVARYQLSGATHGSVKKKQADIDQFFSLVGLEFNQLEIWVEPNPVNAGIDGWNFIYKVRNNSPRELLVDNIAVDQFEKEGNWYVCSWIHPDLPPGQTHPHRYIRWGRTLQPGETVEGSLHWLTNANRDPISTIPLLYQARTAILTAQVKQTDGTTTTQATTTLVAHYDDIWPSAPKSRTRGSSREGGGVFGLMGPINLPH